LLIRAKRKDPSLDLGKVLKSKGLVDDKQYKACRKAQEKHLVGKGMSQDEARLAARGLSGDEGLAILAEEDAAENGGEAKLELVPEKAEAEPEPEEAPPAPEPRA